MDPIDKINKDLATLNSALGDLFAEIVELKSRVSDLEDQLIDLKLQE